MENPLGPHTDYTVRIPIYEGPLDLLLSLIEQAELDITAVSLAMVTDQYLAYIHSLGQANPDDMSAFLIIAARLLQIKSEALLPRPPQREPGEEDVGESLVEQLRLYKRFKEIGAWLDERQQAGLSTYLRVAPPPKVEVKFDPTTLTLEMLITAARALLPVRLKRSLSAASSLHRRSQFVRRSISSHEPFASFSVRHSRG